MSRWRGGGQGEDSVKKNKSEREETKFRWGREGREDLTGMKTRHEMKK